MSRKSVLPHYFHNTNEHRSLRFALFSPAIHHHYEAFKVKTLSRCGFSKLIHLFRRNKKWLKASCYNGKVELLSWWMDFKKFKSNCTNTKSWNASFKIDTKPPVWRWHKSPFAARCVVPIENWFISPQKILKATLESNSDWSLGGDFESRRTSISWEEKSQSKKKTQLNDEAQVTVDFLCSSVENFLLVINAFASSAAPTSSWLLP